MADAVFGTPIDTQTLEGMPEYRNKIIRRSDRAKVARDLMNAGGKDTNCLQYVENLRDQYGSGVKTLCTIYNATGDDLTHVVDHDFHGHIYSKPYPLVIKNGQWGGYLHVHTSGAAVGSAGAVVYRGLNNNDVQSDWMLSWSVPWSTWFGGSNRVYTEIREKGHCEEDADNCWDYIYNKVENNKMKDDDEWNGCVSTVGIGTDTTTTFVGIMSLTGPDLPYLDA